MARASNAIGQTQTAELIHNPAGYHHNVIHSVSLNVALREETHAHDSIIAHRRSLLAAPAIADEKPVQLKKAPGLDKVEANCAACHSLDYIQMNSPYPNAALWDAEVTKMIKAFGAPIDEADAKAIADYLKKNYGS